MCFGCVTCCIPALAQTSEKGKATLALIQSRGSSNGTLSAAVTAAEDSDARDWADMYEDYLDAELEEDEEIESYYFSSAAGRARVVLGNRRWGEGGYMRAGGRAVSVGWCRMPLQACADAIVQATRAGTVQQPAHIAAGQLRVPEVLHNDRCVVPSAVPCLQGACMPGPWCTRRARPMQLVARQPTVRPLAKAAPAAATKLARAAANRLQQQETAVGQVAAVLVRVQAAAVVDKE